MCCGIKGVNALLDEKVHSSLVDLTIGLAKERDDPFRSIVLEVLEHQGICYEEFDPEQTSSKIYPVILITRDHSDSFVSQLSKRCISKNNVIIVSDMIDLKVILDSLSGRRVKQSDRLDLVVNNEEAKLIGKIKESFAALSLPFVRKAPWPNGAKMCCVLTHDVDWFTYSPFHKAVFQGPLSPSKIVKLIFDGLFKKKDYGWNIPEIIDAELKHGAKSTFFLQSQYTKDETRLRQTLELLKRVNFEAALHAYHGAHKDRLCLDKELQDFVKLTDFSPHGIRYHILKFAVPDSWNLESEAGLLYDATFAYNEFFGFRGEVCYPYHPFVNGERLGIIELPTSFMDWTALRRKLRGGEFGKKIKQLKEQVEREMGLLVVNFHNTYLNPDTFPDVYSSFLSLLEEIHEKNYWVATAAECVAWWKARAAAQPKLFWDEATEKVVLDGEFPLLIEFSHKQPEQSRSVTVGSQIQIV
jgi:peptidoglycan/xylan/chitin deacetylase (PgdA/CDA1 family)